MAEPFASLVLVFAAGVLAGFLNTLASSGSAVTLPLLLFLGLPPAVANGTNRLNVLAGGLASTITFARSGVIDWRRGLLLALPTTLGAAVGAVLAAVLGNVAMRWVIVAAVFLAFLMVLARPNRWLLGKSADKLRLGWPQLGAFFAIGVWTGFIVLDSATYMLIGLTLGVGYDLIKANAIKSLLLVTTTVVSLVVFSFHDDVSWPVAVVLALGSVVGAWGAARIAVHEWSKVWVYRLLVVVILAEMIHLGFHLRG